MKDREELLVHLSVDRETTVLTDSEVARLILTLLQREGIAATAMVTL